MKKREKKLTESFLMFGFYLKKKSKLRKKILKNEKIQKIN